MTAIASGLLRSMKVAVEGCCHGKLDAIYAEIAKLEAQNNYKVDLLLICGDFQAVRNWRDLACMARPQKYKENPDDFHKYYSGEKVAPIPTIVIGGNHEASNYMWELYHGGWLARNIYFLGHAGSVLVNGLKIAGVSGIYKHYDFGKGHHEKLPYDPSAMRSIYHTREYDTRRLSLLSSPHIVMSHDWPQNIDKHGDWEDLLKRTGHLKPDVRANKLGSPALMDLLQSLKPQRWFSAHLHTRFEATYTHLDEHVEAEAPMPATTTQFLGLDQCLPERKFLEVIDIDVPFPNPTPVISFDPEWLAINRALHPWFSTTQYQPPLPVEQEARAMVAKELEWVNANIEKDEHGFIPVDYWQTFVKTAPTLGSDRDVKEEQPPAYTNPQTVSFCKMLDIEDKINS